ncbi:MAG: hypothetical protein JO164_07705 [Candidatus Eremiobacteraeota bacterium]|nr:hypothetical protein [Candidatus Eremiobacteraeota bacterium]
MRRARSLALIASALGAALAPRAARADQTATFSGTVAYVDSRRLGVSADRRTRDFIMDSDFTNIHTRDGTKVARSALKVGTYVRVIYLQSSVLGSQRVTDLLVIPPALPIPTGAPTM